MEKVCHGNYSTRTRTHTSVHSHKSNETHAFLQSSPSRPLSPICLSAEIIAFNFSKKLLTDESSSSASSMLPKQKCTRWRWKLPLCATHAHICRYFSIQLKWLICWLFNFHPLWLSNIKAFRCFSHFAPQYQRIAEPVHTAMKNRKMHWDQQLTDESNF